MLQRIIRFSVENKLIIGLLTAALVISGIFALTTLPIDAVPDITNNQVQVITVSPSMAAPEIERLVTFPIEQATSTIPDITEMRSFSRFGLSLVTIVFTDATDVYWARQQVGERLQQVRSQIPASAGNPELAPVTTGLGEIFQYVLKPKPGYESKFDAMQLRTIQDWIVRRQLLGTPGVADVSSFGGYLKQYEIAVKPDKLSSLGVSIRDIFDAIGKASENTGGAYIEKGPSLLFIRTEGLAASEADLREIVIRQTSGGIPVFLRDVAEIRIGHATRYGAMTFNDEGEVAGAVVMMLKGANSGSVIKAVKERITQIEKTLPEGVLIEPFLDRTKMVNNAIGTVEKNLLEGALIVIFILVLFLGNFKAGLIVSSVIPLAMLFAIILMRIFGVSGNLMSLGALDFGLIVDGAVIIVEAVMHMLYHQKHLKQEINYTRKQMDAEVEHAAGKMMGSAVFGQVIILIVYFPILALVGIEGKMFKPMAQTVSFALIGAFILSLTYVPMVTALTLKRKIVFKATFADRVMLRLQRIYKPLLVRSMAFPRVVVGIAVLFFVLSVVVLSRMGGEFIPRLEEGDFAVDTRVLTGSSLTTTVEATQKTAHVLLKNFPEVEKVVTKIGSGEIPTDPMPVEASDMMVILKDKKEWTSAKTFDELANKMSLALEQVPGVSAGFQFPVQMRFNELMTGARQDVVCKVFGENLDSLARYAAALGKIIEKVDGARDIYVETITGLPQIVVQYNRQLMALYQLNIADVNQVVRTAFAGESAGMIYENERRFDVVVRLNSDNRRDLSDVSNLLIPTPSGNNIPLSHVAKVEIQEGPNQIQREDAKRRVIVGFNVRGSDVQTVVEDLQKRVNAQVKFSPGYYVTYGGQFKNLEEAKKRLGVAVPLALGLILVLLYFAFGSVAHGLIIFSAIPLSAIGGVLALWLRDMPFSISAGVGFIALFGVAVLNGIVLLSEFNRLKKEMPDSSIPDIVIAGTATRLRPVLMTASVASLGFLPMALSNGAGAEVQRPLATVVIGGLITATLLTLLVLPILYNWLEQTGRKKKGQPAFTVLLAMCLCFCQMDAFSQQAPQRLPLDSLLAVAGRQNMGLRQGQLQNTYWKQLQQKVYEPGKTNLSAEYGQINSFKKDTRFGITQNIALPVVYKGQAAFYRASESAGEAKQLLQRREMERAVKLSFYSLVDLEERNKLLKELDSLYQFQLNEATKRLAAGETNTLEKASAEMLQQEIRLQQEQLAADVKIEQLKLQFLLNTSDWLLPVYNARKMDLQPKAEAGSFNNHPLVQMLQAEAGFMAAQTQQERNLLKPEFALGYANQSISGWQSTDGTNQRYYGAGNRFSNVQGVMSIPLFNKAVKNKIKAALIKENAAQLAIEEAGKQLQSDMGQWQQELLKAQQGMLYFEKTGRKQTALITSSASISFRAGDINYLQYIQFVSQVVAIKVAYCDAMKAFNSAMVQLEYYGSQ